MSEVGIFSANDIFDIAIETEQLGRAFYEAAAAATEDAQVHALCEWLGHAEEAHERLLRNMKVEIASTGSLTNWGPERHEFISHLVYSRFVPKAGDAVALVAGKSAEELLRLALSFEKDTIIFLYEMRDMVASADTERVNVIIAEEKKHVTRISAALASLA